MHQKHKQRHTFYFVFSFEFDLNWMRQPLTFENISKAAKRVHLYVQRRTESRSICQRGLCVKVKYTRPQSDNISLRFIKTTTLVCLAYLKYWKDGKRISLTICLRSLRSFFFWLYSCVPVLYCICTWCRQLLHRFLGDIGHEAYNGEDDEAGKHAGAGVDAAHYDGVPEKERDKQFELNTTNISMCTQSLWPHVSYL